MPSERATHPPGGVALKALPGLAGSPQLIADDAVRPSEATDRSGSGKAAS